MPHSKTGTLKQRRYVSANGLNIYYEEYGSGRPLILLHGGTLTSSMWRPYLAAFASHFRVITPDSRGHGRTDNPDGEFSYRAMAEDVVAFIQALELVRPLIFGYSDGGQAALELGMHHPGLAGALVIGAAWYKFSKTYADWLKASGFEGPGMVNFRQIIRQEPKLVDLWKEEHSWIDDPDYWQTLLIQISTMWWTPLDYSAGDFQEITEPTLVLLGDRDGLVELEQAVGIYRHIPKAELAILPNGTHMNPNPKLLTQTVLDFLIRQTKPVNEA